MVATTPKWMDLKNHDTTYPLYHHDGPKLNASNLIDIRNSLPTEGKPLTLVIDRIENTIDRGDDPEVAAANQLARNIAANIIEQENGTASDPTELEARYRLIAIIKATEPYAPLATLNGTGQGIVHTVEGIAAPLLQHVDTVAGIKQLVSHPLDTWRAMQAAEREKLATILRNEDASARQAAFAEDRIASTMNTFLNVTGGIGVAKTAGHIGRAGLNAIKNHLDNLQQVVPVPEFPQPAYAGVGVPGVIMATEPMAMAASSPGGASSSGAGIQDPKTIAEKVLGNQPQVLLAKVLIADAGNGDTIIGAGLGNGERRFIRVSPNNDSLLEISPKEAINACRKRSEFEPLQSFLNTGKDASGVGYKTTYWQAIQIKDDEIKTQAAELGQQRKAEKITAAVSSESTVPPAVTGLLARLYPDADRVPIVRMPATLTSISGDTWYLTNIHGEPPKAVRHPNNGSPAEASLLELSEDHRDQGTARKMIEACGEGGGAALDEQRTQAQAAVKQAKQDSEAAERLAAVKPIFPAAESATLIAPLSQTRSGAALYWVQVPNAAPEIVAVAKEGQPLRISYLQAQQDITHQEKQSLLNALINENPLATNRLLEEQALASDEHAQFQAALEQYKHNRQELLKYGPYRWRELDAEHKINPNDHPAVDKMLELARLEFAIPPEERAIRPSAEPIAAIRDRNLDFDADIRANAHADVLHACQAKQIANDLPPDNRLKATKLYNLGAPSGYIVEAAKTGNLTMYLKGLDDYIRARIEYAVETTHRWKNNPSTPNPMVKTNQGYPMPTDPELRKSAIALYTEFADEIFMARYGEPGEQLTRIPLNQYAVCEKGSHALLILNGKDGIRVVEAKNEFSEHLSGPWNFTTLTPEQGLAILDSKINMFRNVNANEVADKLETGKSMLEDAIQQQTSAQLSQTGNDAGLAP